MIIAIKSAEDKVQEVGQGLLACLTDKEKAAALRQRCNQAVSQVEL